MILQKQTYFHPILRVETPSEHIFHDTGAEGQGAEGQGGNEAAWVHLPPGTVRDTTTDTALRLLPWFPFLPP